MAIVHLWLDEYRVHSDLLYWAFEFLVKAKSYRTAFRWG
ncbi:hypothetical protein SCG7086_AL_00290 [Chlamydiales bacterium SCGC AG-110-P3]|nr:hypothetical protein SCG7086_AL_00290 [Chlamydiales bacterium SCGC AG-110-P3]